MPTRIVIRQDGRMVAETARSFGRGEEDLRSMADVPVVLARKPGALRTGCSLQRWVLTAAMEAYGQPGRRRRQPADGRLSNAVLTEGLTAVRGCLRQALSHGAIPPM